MITQQEKTSIFHALHVAGQPIVLFNIWDAGSAQAIASLGAQAIATGSHGVANASGYEDGEKIPLEVALANAQRVVLAAGDIPVTMDIETGYGKTPDDVKNSIKQVITSGVVGINFEDTVLETGELRPIDEQIERIKAVRSAAEELGVNVFINARTDLFKIAPPDKHDDSLVDEALGRAVAFKQAGADGFFPVLIRKMEHIQRICHESPLPVNIIYLPNMGIPEPKELAMAGASRISYGPGPYLAMIEWLKAQAQQSLLEK